MAKQHNSAQNNAAIKRKAVKLEQSLSAARGEGLSLEKLKAEADLANYLKMIKGFAQRYCVMVVASDTPWGPAFTQELTGFMTDIGFKENLYNKFRCAYAAVIDSGELVFEKLENDRREYIDETIKLSNGDNVHLFSSGYDSMPRKKCVIKINDKRLMIANSHRGILFAVYDKCIAEYLDVAFFDTYNNLECYRPLNYFNAVKSFAAAHPGVFPIGYFIPGFCTCPYTECEKEIYNKNYFYDCASENMVLKKYYTEEEMKDANIQPTSYYDHRGFRHMEDLKTKYFNVIDGHRVTSFQPDYSEICVYVLGDCRAMGSCLIDDDTIESFLQKEFNNHSVKVKVMNYGTPLPGNDIHEYDRSRISLLNSLPVKSGDIVLVQEMAYSSAESYPIIDLLDIFYKPHKNDFFFDIFHFSPHGNQYIAEKLFEGLMDQGLLEKAQKLANIPASGLYEQSHSNFDQATNEQLAEYKSFLTDFYNSTLKQTIGAIVMNCNPFTLGHRYLIEKALEQCDFLIVFLVEEDKSFFSFEDRLKLIDEGTKDIPNLAIIPSGRFVLSSLTFSGYFVKQELQDRIIDTSLDVSVFAREIAPCLHITKRFAGEEPFDNVTRQYNESMSRVLPEYGIEFVEIPRREISGTAISASRVRALLENRDFDEIKPLVPASTFEYLLSNYS